MFALFVELCRWVTLITDACKSLDGWMRELGVAFQGFRYCCETSVRMCADLLSAEIFYPPHIS